MDGHTDREIRTKYCNPCMFIVLLDISLFTCVWVRLTVVGFIVTFSRYPDSRLMKGSYTEEEINRNSSQYYYTAYFAVGNGSVFLYLFHHHLTLQLFS